MVGETSRLDSRAREITEYERSPTEGGRASVLIAQNIELAKLWVMSSA